MADQTNKRRNLATKLITQSTALMDAVNNLYALADEYVSAGLTFEDSDFQGTALEHVTAADMVGVIANAETVKNYLETNFIDNVFKIVRQ